MFNELPSILLWAIDGWKRLHERGHFQEPTASVELRNQFRSLSAPIADFVKECCELGEAYETPKDELYDQYRAFSDRCGRKHVEDKAGFGRALFAAIPMLGDCRPRRGGKLTRCYRGLKLK